MSPKSRFYNYKPSLAAPIIFTIAFAAMSLLACFQFYRALKNPTASKLDKRRTLIVIPFIFGGLCEIVGCICRIINSQDPNAKNPFIVQAVLLLVAAALFAATIYMILGRIIAMLNSAHQSLVPVKWLTKIFVLGDVISFLMQGIGASVRAADPSKSDHAERIIIGGLFVQIGFFGVFIIVAALFQYKVWRNPSTILITLFVCSILILVRCIIRAVEYLQGYDGFIISNEAFLYTLDLLLMFLNMVLLSWQDNCAYFVEVGPLSRDENFINSKQMSFRLEQEKLSGPIAESDSFRDEARTMV
ncbi:hypothetical protein CA3LBN_001317 [Candidozyma haemuli]|uniref:Uncharacterized protein n=1 Tax=Candidozyma haemuli TaxID=45357 RepID=A0ABX8I3T3_9ASCO|nr:hypothetical protein CA3LBN_001317 [[Candida] haemuloni]